MESLKNQAVAFAGLDAWYVMRGANEVGPVSFDLLAKGVAHGRIPDDAFVRHASWPVWRSIADVPDLAEARRDRDARGGVRGRDDEETHSGVRAVVPQDDLTTRLAGAADEGEAMLFALGAAVAACRADVGIMHRPRGEAWVTSFAHGRRASDLLGTTVDPADPVLRAARGGETVVGEALGGDAERAIASRLGHCSGALRGVAMVPVWAGGELRAVIEVGRFFHTFRARDVARVEDVADTLATAIDAGLFG